MTRDLVPGRDRINPSHKLLEWLGGVGPVEWPTDQCYVENESELMF